MWSPWSSTQQGRPTVKLLSLLGNYSGSSLLLGVCLWTWTGRGHCEVMPGHSDSGDFSLLEGESCKGCSPVESRT